MTVPNVAAAPPVREASKLGQVSWALFDWANQPFFTIITTFIFAPYFANVLVGDPVKGQSAWALTTAGAAKVEAMAGVRAVARTEERQRQGERQTQGRAQTAMDSAKEGIRLWWWLEAGEGNNTKGPGSVTARRRARTE